MITQQQISDYLVVLNRAHRERFKHFGVGKTVKFKTADGEIVSGRVTESNDFSVSVDNGLSSFAGSKHWTIAWSEIINEG